MGEGDHGSFAMKDGRSTGEYIDRHMGTVKEESAELSSPAKPNIEAPYDHKTAGSPFSSDHRHKSKDTRISSGLPALQCVGVCVA